MLRILQFDELYFFIFVCCTRLLTFLIYLLKLAKCIRIYFSYVVLYLSLMESIYILYIFCNLTSQAILTITVFTFPAFFGFTYSGKRCLDLGKHRFTVHQNEGVKVRWRCVKKNTGCPSFVTTIDNIIIKVRKNHNHP